MTIVESGAQYRDLAQPLIDTIDGFRPVLSDRQRPAESEGVCLRCHVINTSWSLAAEEVGNMLMTMTIDDIITGAAPREISSDRNNR